MGLVQLYKAHKAFKRSKRLKGRAEWQDVVPDTKQGRDAYKIADRYQSRFQRAFMDATKNILADTDIDKRFKAAYNTGSIMAAMDTLPMFHDEENSNVMTSFKNRMKSAYADVIQAAGTTAMKEVNAAVGTNIKFEVFPPPPPEPDIEIVKAEKKKITGPSVAAVPVNTYSVAWMDAHVAELVTQGITLQQRKIVEQVLLDGFEKGIRAEEAMKTIRANIGLTNREYTAVKNRRLKLEKAGMKADRIDREAARYEAQLTRKRAQRIARTETIKAQAQGRSDSWRVAQEQGALPPVQRMWISPPPSPNPNRPCEICLDLDTKTAPIGGTYDSTFEGPIEGPPAHPDCLPGYTTVAAAGVSAVSKRWYDGDMLVLRTSKGKNLVCTPNHPILTESGWIPAQGLNVGSRIVCDRRGQGKSPAFVGDNHENVPTVVDTVSNFFDESRFSRLVPMPGSAKDFHGDGLSGQITIVRADGSLGNSSYIMCPEHLAEGKLLVSRSRSQSLPGFGIVTKLLERFLCAPNGFICSLCHSLSFGGICLRHALIHRSAAVSGLDSGFEQQSSDDISADSPGFAERLLAESRHVILDNIVNADVQRFSGHVFNLQSNQGFYIAQSIYTHNCRCTETLVRR